MIVDRKGTSAQADNRSASISRIFERDTAISDRTPVTSKMQKLGHRILQAGHEEEDDLDPEARVLTYLDGGQGHMSFAVAVSPDKRRWALKAVDFPSRIVAVAETTGSVPMERVAGTMMGAVAARRGEYTNQVVDIGSPGSATPALYSQAVLSANA